ncbi:MAG TPA: hypothetical protein VHQ86_06435 [Candidatus Saccharimonadia bacterium]|jgi:predicted PhzF superfamily epimerase YddE/YHI9|nr:hypothetical protein [Candidatus Saccharimonadia bacterium]
MIQAHILDVFVDEAGKFGGGMGMILDEGRSIPDIQRAAITQRLGYEEAIFVNDLKQNDISVITHEREIRFAGQPVVGASWLLSELRGRPIDRIHCLGGEVRTWQAHGLVWIRASLDIMPDWNIQQLPTVEAVERLTAADADSLPHTLVWAWTDQAKGKVRARTFAADWETVPEVETNGSGSMMLSNLLQRDLQIKHGRGSIIHAMAEKGNFAAVGGRVVKREVVDLGI